VFVAIDSSVPNVRRTSSPNHVGGFGNRNRSSNTNLVLKVCVYSRQKYTRPNYTRITLIRR